MSDLCPITLPNGWTAESYLGNVLISSAETDDLRGHVTVSTTVRGFALGMSSVSNSRADAAKYTGRGWQTRLFTDAVQTLSDVFTPAPKA